MDLLTFAKNEMPKGLGLSSDKPTVIQAIGGEFIRLHDEMKYEKGGKRRLAFTKFVKEHNNVLPTDLKALLRLIGEDRLVTTKAEANSAFDKAQVIETYTVQGVLKYLSEQAVELVALLQCFEDRDWSNTWITMGLDARCTMTTEATGSGRWIGVPAWTGQKVIDLFEHVRESCFTTVPIVPSKALADLPDLDPAVEAMLDATLRGAGVSNYGVIRQRVKELSEEAEAAKNTSGVNITIGGATYSSASSEIPDLTGVEGVTVSDLGLPNGMNLTVPKLTWSFDHPAVPAANEDYVFRSDLVDKLSYAIMTNERLWLNGHTGTGKSSLVDEFAARTNYPVVRINFDGEVGRMDLIGREVLREVNGTTVSEFVEGIIPQAMQQPCILLLDEIDFVRPEVSYVLQRILENDGALVLTEDGGRRVEPHPMFRIVATSNTKGQGDETGHYTGARTQSAAFLDRFTVWGEVGYLDKRAVLKMAHDNVFMADYYAEHVAAFLNNSVHLPMTPRSLMAWADMTKITNNARVAFEATVLNRASEADQAVMRGILDRVMA